MTYASLSQVKNYLGITVTSDDGLLTEIIARAEGIIDARTGRHFEAETDTKYFGADALDGALLYLWGYDLLTVTELTDGSGAVVDPINYRLEPRNSTHSYVIRLLNGMTWNLTDGDAEVTVTGTWGYSQTAPEDVVHACVRLSAFIYRQKDTSADVDRPLITGDGVTIMPSGVPKDVMSILDGYRRRIGA